MNSPPETDTQGAQRKLGQLGIRTAWSPDGSLEGELCPPPGAFINPLDGLPVERVRFVLLGNDRMRFTAPAQVVRLPPYPFLGLSDLSTLWPQLGVGIRNLQSGAQRNASALTRWGFVNAWDAERVLVWSRYTVAGVGDFTFEVNESGAFLVHIRPSRPDRKPTQFSNVPVNLQGLADRTDLDLYLGGLLDHPPEGSSEPAAGPFKPPPLPRATSLAERTRSAAGLPAVGAALPPAPTQFMVPHTSPGTPAGFPVEALARFGAGAGLADGFTVWVEGPQGTRFQARHVGGTTFQGTLTVGGQPSWENRFELNAFPGMDALLRSVGGLSAPHTPAPAPEPPSAAVLSWAVLPRVGEMWVMRVIIEAEDGAEVRYQAVDSEGRAYGAPRVLPKAHFHAAFPACRMLVRVLGVEPERIAYTQLSVDRQPVEMPKVVGVGAFMGTFVPEAGDY